MSEFKKLIDEIKKTLRKILLFDTFIETLVVFLSVYIIAFIFGLSIYFALAPAILYFIIMVIKRKDLTSIQTVEKKYPILNEALRTANDTVREDNYLVNELRQQVKSKVKKVSASSFINLRGDFVKISLSLILVFAIISLSICKGTNETCQNILSSTDIRSIQKNIDISELMNRINEDSKNFDINRSRINDDYEFEDKQMLLGDNSVATLGNDELNLMIKLSNDQIDITDVNDDVKKKKFMDMDITDISASSDVSFTEEISKEHKDVVKNYFKSINR